MFLVSARTSSSSRSLRVSITIVACATTLALVGAARARDDAGVHAFSAGTPSASRSPAVFQPLVYAPVGEQAPALTITRGHRRPTVSLAAGVPRAREHVLRVARDTATTIRARQVVTIYTDLTLRRGDAVMTAKGLRIFEGSSTFPYRPEDFSTLASTQSLRKTLRRALVQYDQDPTSRRQS